MRPIAMIGALLTIGVALFVVSKLTSPTSAVKDVAVTPPPAAPEAEGTDPVEDPEKPAEPDPTDVNFPENPYDLKQPGPYPKAVIDEARFEFGAMPLGTTRSHPFIIRNEGDAPLKLEKGPLQCKCTMPALKDKEIPPGGQAEILLEWKPVGVQEAFEKEAIIWTNDPANPRISLTIFGDVITDDFWEPTDSFNADQLRQGQEKTFTGYILSRTREDLKIERVDQAGNTLKIEHEPAGEDVLKAKEAKAGYVFKITVPASEDIALIRETITVTVNSATNTHIIWQVFGSRVGPINIIGPGWYAEKQLVQLGQFRAAEGAEKRFSLFLLDRAEQDLEFTEVKVDGPLKVSLVKDEKWAGKANDRYYMTVQFVPGGPIGVHNADQPVPVTITTNHPKLPTISFNIAYDAH